VLEEDKTLTRLKLIRASSEAKAIFHFSFWVCHWPS